MNRGIGRIKRQAAGRGLFAEVSLEVTPNKRSAFGVNLEDGSTTDTKYIPTIQSAITFAEEKSFFKLKRQDLFNLSVTLTRLVTSDVDTTCTAVFYATILAVEDALKITIPDVEPIWIQRELKLTF